MTHPCEVCGNPIEDPYKVCYGCWKAQKGPQNAQTPVKPVYTPPTAVFAPNAKETAIARAHEENMEANKQLVAAIIYLADAIKGEKR